MTYPVFIFTIMLALLVLLVCIPLAILLFTFLLVCWIVIVDRIQYLIIGRVRNEGAPMSMGEAFNDLKCAMFN